MRNIFFKRLLLTGFSFIACLLLTEIILGIILKQPLYSFEKGLFTESDKYIYCLTPLSEKKHSQPEYSYTIKSNSYGFRGREPNPNAEFRVLILGDSVGMGQGVKKNLCELSLKYLKEKGVNIDIFNTSISGYCLINELLVLKNLIGVYRPDLVILLFSPNDLKEKQSLTVQNGYLVFNKTNNCLFNLKAWLNNHSRLYCLIKKICYLKTKSTSSKMRRKESVTKEDIKLAIKRVAKMEDICVKNKAEFITLFIPLISRQEQNQAFQQTKSSFIALLKDKSLEIADWSLLLPRGNPDQLFYEIDAHWNNKGHIYFSKHLNQIIQKTIDKP